MWGGGRGAGREGCALGNEGLQRAQPAPGHIQEAESRILPQVQDLTSGTAEQFPAGSEATPVFHIPSLPFGGFRGIVREDKR